MPTLKAFAELAFFHLLHTMSLFEKQLEAAYSVNINSTFCHNFFRCYLFHDLTERIFVIHSATSLHLSLSLLILSASLLSLLHYLISYLFLLYFLSPLSLFLPQTLSIYLLLSLYVYLFITLFLFHSLSSSLRITYLSPIFVFFFFFLHEFTCFTLLLPFFLACLLHFCLRHCLVRLDSWQEEKISEGLLPPHSSVPMLLPIFSLSLSVPTISLLPQISSSGTFSHSHRISFLASTDLYFLNLNHLALTVLS